MKELLIAIFAFITFSVYAQGDMEVVNIENKAVQAYMADNSYANSQDYKTTVISNYNNKSYGEKLEHPAGKLVSWSPTDVADSISEIRITVTREGDATHPMFYTTPTTSDSTFTITNLFPNDTYRYAVMEMKNSKEMRCVASGSFRTTGQIRMLAIDGVKNVRDLGGWPTSFGYPLKYGKLYRSGNMDHITKEGIAEFKNNQRVGAELDLRAGSALQHSKLGQDVDFVVYGTTPYSKGLYTEYAAFVDDLKWIVARLREGKNVDWHCHVGCDRCGTLCFLIEGLLGMSETDMARDYEFSTLAGYPRKRSYGSYNTMIPYIKSFGPENDLAQCFYNYWTSHGVSTDDLDFLRKEMIDAPITK